MPHQHIPAIHGRRNCIAARPLPHPCVIAAQGCNSWLPSPDCWQSLIRLRADDILSLGRSSVQRPCFTINHLDRSKLHADTLPPAALPGDEF